MIKNLIKFTILESLRCFKLNTGVKMKKKMIIIAIILLLLMVTFYFARRVFYNTMSKFAEEISLLSTSRGMILFQEITKRNDKKIKDLITSNHIFVTFKNLNGLRTGDQVRYMGKKVGVAEIFWFNSDENERYKVLIKFRDKNFKIKINSKFYIFTLGLANEKYIDIIPPEKEEGFLKKGYCLKGEESEAIPLVFPLEKKK